MPQGKDFSASASAAMGLREKETYKRKRTIEHKGRAFIAPKSAAAAESVHQGFQDALPQMTKNIEMIVAGRLISNGSHLQYVYILVETIKPSDYCTRVVMQHGRLTTLGRGTVRKANKGCTKGEPVFRLDVNL
jgi:hypothetical protein